MDTYMESQPRFRLSGQLVIGLALAVLGAAVQGVLVDDVDPFAEPDTAVGLSCRLYRTEDGGRAGSPTLEQLISVVS